MALTTTDAQATDGAGRDDRLSREIMTLAGVVVLGTIMTVLDLTIVNVAIPTVESTFRASVDAVQWVMTGYMLAFATVIPLTGWASERFGAKRVWLAALVLFLVGSVLAGGATSLGWLIAFRVLQGLGAGMILPVGQTILAQSAGPQRMGRVMSVIGMPLLLAPVLGPVVGGAIVGAASWRWVFFINLPVGAAALLAAWRLLPSARSRPGKRLDLRGLVLLSPGIAVLLYGMSQAGSAGFASLRAGVPALAGLALISLYFWHAAVRGASGAPALIDISLLRRRGFAAAAALNLLLMAGLFGSLILIPLYYQVVRHETALHTGVLLAPQGIGAALALPVAGWLADKVGARGITVAGIAAAALGLLAYTQVGPRTSQAYLAAALLVIGLGLGATISPSMAAAFRVLSSAEMPRGTSALNAVQRIAGAVGTAVFAIILQAHGGPTRVAAFGIAFWAAVAVVAISVVPALFLPRAQRESR